MRSTLLSDLESAGRQWIIDSRNRHRPNGTPLDAETSGRLLPYFSTRTLDEIRIHRVSRIADPPFLQYGDLFGFGLMLDFQFAAGITFIDTVVLAERRIGSMDRAALMFHEAVHVAQYRVLGLERFIRLYIAGLASHRSYQRIPIETQAYRLQQRFETGALPFSVEDEILRDFSNA